jgi:hypothetical protein
MSPGDFILWCCVGIAGCSLLREVELFVTDLKAERLEAWKRKPVEAVDAVSPESVPEPRTDALHTENPAQPV